MKRATLIFDLDGTILDTLTDLTDSVNYALEKGGFPPREKSEIRFILGNGARNLIYRSLPEKEAEKNLDATLEIFREHYEVNKSRTTAPYAGIVPMMEKLKADGFKIAIVSNKPDDAVQGLCDKFFSDVCDFAIGNCDAFPKKPAPDAIFHAIKKVGGEVENAVYIGDSEVDVLTAKSAGIPCISVMWGFRDVDYLKENGATIFAKDADDLAKIIESL